MKDEEQREQQERRTERAQREREFISSVGLRRKRLGTSATVARESRCAATCPL